MTFNFYPAPSRIVQFVYFPALSGYQKSEKAFGSLINDLVNPGSIDRWERIADELAPVREDFARYQLSSFSYYFMLLFQTDLTALTSEEDYLGAVKALSREALLDHLARFLEKHLDMVLPLPEKTDQYLTEAFRIVSGSTLDNSDRWKLLALLEDPEQERDHYVDFMTGIIPLFRKHYAEVDFAVRAYAERFEKELAVDDQSPLMNLMNQYLVSESVEDLKQSKIINFWFLGIQDYHFLIIPHQETANIFLGISVLEYFARLQRFEERNKEDRITVFKNLSDKTRYEVLKLIAEGESSTKVLAEKLGVTSAAISYHLKQLTNDRLIRFDASRPRQRYCINESRMEEAVAGLREDLRLP